jgi:hypothetical protein
MTFLRHSFGVGPQRYERTQGGLVALFFGDANKGGIVLPGLAGQTGLSVLRQASTRPEVHHDKTEGPGTQQVFCRSGCGDGIRTSDHGYTRNVNSGIRGIRWEERTLAAGGPGHRLTLYLSFEHKPKHKRQGGTGRSTRYFGETTGKSR